MSVTIIPFQPVSTSPFQFQVTLDGQTYNVIVTWNIFGLRYYINVYSTQGVLICAKPLVGSPIGWDISLVAGYFTSTLVYREDNQQFEVSPTPISYPNFGAINPDMLDVNENNFILDQSVMG